jgi:hypothetical protein
VNRHGFRPGGYTPGGYGEAFSKAEQFLAQGRKKTYRKVASNTRLQRIDDDTIALVLHQTAVVSYHRDGSMTIYGGGWNTVTTKRRIADYSPVRVSTVNGAWILGHTGERTEPRVRKCRTCRGAAPAPGCYRCQGAGVVDYGSNPVPILGAADEAYRVDADGTFIEFVDEPSAGPSLPSTPYGGWGSGQHIEPTYVPASPHVHHAEIVDRIAAVIPGINASVKHPGTQMAEPVRDIIISLNDQFGWSREQIADWLDTLDVDLRFPVPA